MADRPTDKPPEKYPLPVTVNWVLVVGEDEAIIMPGDILHADIFDLTMNREWPAA